MTLRTRLAWAKAAWTLEAQRQLGDIIEYIATDVMQCYQADD